MHVGLQPLTVHAGYVLFGVCASEAVGLYFEVLRSTTCF